MLDTKSTTLLANEQGLPMELRRLLHEHSHGTLGAQDMRRLCNMLRVTECDLRQALPVRFVAGILLITVELSLQHPRSKSRAETQLEQG